MHAVDESCNRLIIRSHTNITGCKEISRFTPSKKGNTTHYKKVQRDSHKSEKITFICSKTTRKNVNKGDIGVTVGKKPMLIPRNKEELRVSTKRREGEDANFQLILYLIMCLQNRHF